MIFFFFLIIRRPPRSTLFPSTTLSRPLRRLQVVPDPAAVGREPFVPADLHQHRARVNLHGRRAVRAREPRAVNLVPGADRKSTRLNSSHANISYAVFCLKKKKKKKIVYLISYVQHSTTHGKGCNMSSDINAFMTRTQELPAFSKLAPDCVTNPLRPEHDV